MIMLLWPFRKKKYYNYNEVWSIIEKKYFEGFLYFNNSNEATKYFEKYKDIPFSEKLQYALVCYSGDNCEAVNDYLKNRFEGESPEQYDNRKHQWKASIIHTCIENMYDYNNWINIDDNVIVVRYLHLGKNSFSHTSKTLISCSLNLNIMSEVFSDDPYFNGAPYYMGQSDTLLIILLKKGTKILCYDQLNDMYAIKQSEILLSAETKFKILETYNISNNQIKKIFVVTPESDYGE